MYPRAAFMRSISRSDCVARSSLLMSSPQKLVVWSRVVTICAQGRRAGSADPLATTRWCPVIRTVEEVAPLGMLCPSTPHTRYLTQHRFRHALQLFTHLGCGLDMFGAHDHPVGTGIEERLHDRPVRRLAIDGNGNRPWIPPRLLRQRVERAAAGLNLCGGDPVGQPAIGMGHHPAQHILGVSPKDNRRIRLLGGFGIGADGWKIEVTAVVLRLVMGPERLHDLDGFPCLRPAVREVATHECGFLPQPTRANAEQEAAAAKQIEA